MEKSEKFKNISCRHILEVLPKIKSITSLILLIKIIRCFLFWKKKNHRKEFSARNNSNFVLWLSLSVLIFQKIFFLWFLMKFWINSFLYFTFLFLALDIKILSGYFRINKLEPKLRILCSFSTEILLIITIFKKLSRTSKINR